MTPPAYARAFADALLAEPARRITIPGFDPPLLCTPEIRDTLRIKYRDDPCQLVQRAHEYTIAASEPIEVSLQLYVTTQDYWRLFAYCRAGMLFSVNLTLPRERGSKIIQLRQRLTVISEHMASGERSQAMEDLAEHLRTQGLTVSEKRVVELGSFDFARQAFVGTTARRFIRQFLTTAVIKGHFMGNKRYRLRGLAPVPQRGPARLRALLEAERAEAEDEGFFDPSDEVDARERAYAAIVRRQGQRQFRYELLDAYEGRCAISQYDVADALHAAHIVGYRGPHTNHVTNGLLLRADLHTLFDLGHLTVDTADMTLRISESLRGTTYEDYEGRPLRLPRDAQRHPSKEALDQHRQRVGR